MKITKIGRKVWSIGFKDKTEFLKAIDAIVLKFGTTAIKPDNFDGYTKFKIIAALDREYPCTFSGPGPYGSDLVYDTYSDFWNDLNNFGMHYIGIDGDHHLSEIANIKINGISCTLGVSESDHYSIAFSSEEGAKKVASWMQDV